MFIEQQNLDIFDEFQNNYINDNVEYNAGYFKGLNLWFKDEISAAIE